MFTGLNSPKAVLTFAIGRLVRMEAALYKFRELTAEAQAARLLQCRHEGLTSIRDLAVTTGLAIERIELLMCRGLSTLIARGYPVEELCATYRVTPDQLRRVAFVPVFSNMFRPLA